MYFDEIYASRKREKSKKRKIVPEKQVTLAVILDFYSYS